MSQTRASVRPGAFPCRARSRCAAPGSFQARHANDAVGKGDAPWRTKSSHRWALRCARPLSRRVFGGLAAGALAALGLTTAAGSKKNKKKRKKPCKSGTTRCGKGCVNTKTSATHCGGCNQGCAANEVCLHGGCSRYQFVTAWGSEGDGDDQFSALQAIALDTVDNVYAADTGNHRVQKFDNDGTFITKWGKENNEEGTADGEFAFPEGIAVAPDGRVLVTDHNNFRVQTFDGNGVFQDTWPAVDEGDAPFGPEAIAVDSGSNSFIVDRLGNRIVKFDSDGAVLMSFGNEFSSLFGVAVDDDGNVFIADSGNHRIEKFAPNAQAPDVYGHVGTIAGPNSGSGDGELDTPAGIDVDSDGNIYVADLLNHRIQKFAPNAQDPRPVRLRHRLGQPRHRRRPVQRADRRRGRH